ncbi:hypothetical protein DL89DRAFT_2896 [Linderina pennispora]|uniref:Uncharacterized protein n=1 Tax=Linderina pennispora TaxID=61395 RepID=A0A1Y1WKI4_9FUNG|nr:uncharacterized protein DL89DRAFT_2896 [Linderina pennispora]ORX73716.1 hypothetical protein DL89DRAFT_2896 [Linderina pennispora]
MHAIPVHSQKSSWRGMTLMPSSPFAASLHDPSEKDALSCGKGAYSTMHADTGSRYAEHRPAPYRSTASCHLQSQIIYTSWLFSFGEGEERMGLSLLTVLVTAPHRILQLAVSAWIPPERRSHWFAGSGRIATSQLVATEKDADDGCPAISQVTKESSTFVLLFGK